MTGNVFQATVVCFVHKVSTALATLSLGGKRNGEGGDT